MCHFLGKHTKVEPLLKESAKKLKQAQKHDLARNIKNMVLVSILTISTQYYICQTLMCALFMANTPSLKYFMLESAKKG